MIDVYVLIGIIGIVVGLHAILSVVVGYYANNLDLSDPDVSARFHLGLVATVLSMGLIFFSK